ncbi:MAG: hypothetical protein WKF97_09115 [Chitinophagaceae bacterium]
MTISITYDKLIKDVQAEFNQSFPFLKIEFFRKGYRFSPFKQRKDCLPTHVSFGMSYRNKKTGRLDITPFMTVKELEKTCEEQFGIIVQVYRKSGNVWLETTMTDNWTIKQQNDHGGEIMLH